MRPPAGWDRDGARIISHRLGPNAALETILIDKGALAGLHVNTPVISPEGVVGRVLRLSPNAANVLLITDPNSRIPVASQINRTQGILRGEGPNRELTVEYVPLGAPIEEGEVLVTSGLEEIFPKGLPAARVTRVVKGGSSLFQTVFAEPLFTPERLEEVALLRRSAGALVVREEMALQDETDAPLTPPADAPPAATAAGQSGRAAQPGQAVKPEQTAQPGQAVKPEQTAQPGQAVKPEQTAPQTAAAKERKAKPGASAAPAVKPRTPSGQKPAPGASPEKPPAAKPAKKPQEGA